jgi:hypothetical protein
MITFIGKDGLTYWRPEKELRLHNGGRGPNGITGLPVKCGEEIRRLSGKPSWKGGDPPERYPFNECGSVTISFTHNDRTTMISMWFWPANKKAAIAKGFRPEMINGALKMILYEEPSTSSLQAPITTQVEKNSIQKRSYHRLSPIEASENENALWVAIQSAMDRPPSKKIGSSTRRMEQPTYYLVQTGYDEAGKIAVKVGGTGYSDGIRPDSFKTGNPRVTRTLIETNTIIKKSPRVWEDAIRAIMRWELETYELEAGREVFYGPSSDLGKVIDAFNAAFIKVENLYKEKILTAVSL